MTDLQGHPDAVGYVVGEVRTDAFTFVTNPDLGPPRLEYIVVRGVRERSGDDTVERDVLAQVSSLSVSSRLLSTSMNYSEVEAILRRLGASPPVVVGQAKVLGYLEGRTVRLPRGAAMPGAVVERAPDDLLRAFFSRDVEAGIDLGSLMNRPQVDVLLDPNGLNRHLAVIAQTGAGKSYTVGVILEQLLQLGGTVVVFDPNSDYVLMNQDAEHRPTPFGERVEVYRVPSEQQSRIPDETIGRPRRITIQFSNLEVDEICEFAGIAETFTNIRKAVRTACENLQGRDFTPADLLAELERLAAFGELGGPPPDPLDDARAAAALPGLNGNDRDAEDEGAPPPDTDDVDAWFEDGAAGEGPPAGGRDGSGAGTSAGGGKPPTPDTVAGAQKAQKYIEFLDALPIWGHADLPLDDVMRPMRLSTIDLAGVDRRIADFIVTKIVREVWQRATRHGLDRPVFLVLEEAHNFVPAGRDEGQASYWLKRIASEGRKFGVFLVMVTQRPYRVHQDTLSQCGSQIIMRLTNPEDQNAVRRASESISEALLSDLPGLNIGEAVVLGPLVRVPVMIRVGRRQSAEGGSDIDIVERLADARREMQVDRHVDARRAERLARGRSAWREEV